MKRYPVFIIGILLFAFALLIFLNNSEKSTSSEKIFPGLDTLAENELSAFAERMKGVWVYEKADSLQLLNPFENHELLIQINPLHIVDGQLKVKISTYCFPAEADYLHFEYTGDFLTCVQASKAHKTFPFERLAHLRLSEHIVSGDTSLFYEAKSADRQIIEKKYLQRVDKLNLESAYWACGLQSYLEDFLRFGAYIVYDHRKQAQLDNPLFDTFEPEIEFEYLAPFMPYFPMYEEYCIRADFPIVVLQSLQTNPPSKIFAIEWKRDRIELYATGVSENSLDGAFPIRREALAFSLIYL